MNTSQIRQIMRLLKDAKPVTAATVITVGHIADLQPGDVVIKISDPETGGETRATIIRAAKEAPDDQNLREHNEEEDK